MRWSRAWSKAGALAQLTFVLPFVVEAQFSNQEAEDENGWKPPGPAYLDPHPGNGSMLVASTPTFGEPLNIIISAESDPRVLVPTLSNGGLYNYFEAFAYGGECLGLHLGGFQHANLGDGQGFQAEWGVLRYQYFHDHWLGTCLETIYGGSHFRLFRQATTGAYFLSASDEKRAVEGHEITQNGYDLNRNYIVGNTTGHEIEPERISHDYVLSGIIEKRGWVYNTTVEWVDNLFSQSRVTVNHYDRVQTVGSKVTDGWTAILTVRVARAISQGY